MSLLSTLLVLAAAPQAAPQPALEVASLIRGTSLNPDTHLLFFLNAVGAFLPDESYPDSRDQVVRAFEPRLVLTKKGASAPLGDWPLYARRLDRVFCELNPRAGEGRITIPGAGEYELALQIGDERYTTLPFEVETVGSGDPFDPVTRMYMDGPWADLACLHLGGPNDPRGLVSVRHWSRGGRYNPSGKDEDIELEIRYEGRTLYEGATRRHTANPGQSGWLDSLSALKFPTADGGGPVREPDLLKRDGTYEIVRTRAGEVDRVWRFEVAGGKAVPHARQAFGYSPRGDYLLPRVPGGDNRPAADLVWMEALDAADAKAAASAGPAPVAGPTPELLARWTTARKLSPKALAPVTVATSTPRVDAGLVAGSGFVAYGTGAVTGVAYVRTSDGVERTIPNGAKLHSKLLAAAGTTLVSAKGRQLVVFDTDNEQLTEIPAEVVHLAHVKGDRYQATPFAADGHLVAVLCDPRKTTDRRMVKVLDVSGPEPVVLALSNPDLEVNRIDGIAVDAETGTVALTSDREDCLAVSVAIADAPFTRVDLSAHDGVGGRCRALVDGGRLVYYDGARRLRRASPDGSQVEALGTLANDFATYATFGGQLAFAAKEGSGGMYDVYTVEASAARASTEGEALGRGYSLAVAPDGRVYAAGDGKGGVGSSEWLEVLDGGSWKRVKGPDGSPLMAVDVVAGDDVVAFKHGKARDVKVGYIQLR